LIRDVNPDSPGVTHDARVWAFSGAKQYVEAHLGGFFIVGDSAYPLSPVLMKVYSAREAENDINIRRFNTTLSGVRTVLTENVYGQWKQEFPCLRSLRTNYETSKDIILATAILHNIRIKMQEV
jgi:hypothetical protein